VEVLDYRDDVDVAPEEAGRQAVYGFLARVLARPATSSELDFATALAGEETSLNQAFAEFRKAFQTTSAERIERCYHDLFIGVGRGELLPYASYYLTGFLNEKPLAELRVDLEQLGFARAEGHREPEDHIASLCDVMAQLIDGTARGEFDFYTQDRFFNAHIRPWAEQFFADLEAAKSAGLYRTVATIGTIFMAIEEESFGMIARA
jgi:TorA maturation chaperone TorD